MNLPTKWARSEESLHAPGALASWDEVAKALSIGKANQIEGFLIALFDDWINGARFHKGWAETEGSLDGNSKFYAIKRIPVRAYFWYAETLRDTIIISHYVYKRWNKLRSRDAKRVKANWAKEKAGEMR